jgi:hypothetical protein
MKWCWRGVVIILIFRNEIDTGAYEETILFDPCIRV